MSTTSRTPPARVSALRTLSVLLAFTAAVGLVFGTAGFSAMEADRGLAVNVTDDEDAYLGYEAVTDTVESGDPTVVVEYHNRFSGELTLDVTVEAGGQRHEDVNVTLDQGEEEPIEVTLTCSDADEEVDLRFVATGNGSGVNVSLERTHTVTCESPDTSGNTTSTNSTTTNTTGTNTSTVDASDLTVVT
ncbi:hypothetical protein SAMN04488066_105171 [Halorubrum aquaticum]|uniref:Uncharacterized protein n=1 Tax=Halorubrum aquaticum TaxID=387340 RepID=A0A1I3AHG7_9EURY|nr:hypothetical protein [Halorubrum aquaticum]SFH48791.1 hypothetical protein SAMN04488066_105171 [Halorubrum aquaticum]